MARMKNQRIYSDNIAWITGLYEDCRDYIGRECSLEIKEGQGTLTIFALPQRRKTRKEKKRSERSRTVRS